jgi:hypothetical protein
MSNEIPKEELFEHVKISATIETAANLPGTEGWLKAKVSKLPTKIFDINGEILFYDYPVQETAGKVMGFVRANHRKFLGAPVVAYEVGPRRWDFKAAVDKLNPMFKQKFPKLKVKDVKLVCYSYPKIGVMFEAVDPTGAACRYIFDIASLAAVPEKKPGREIEGFYAWSYLESLTEQVKTAQSKRYEIINKKLREIPERDRNAMLKAEVFAKYAKSAYVIGQISLMKTKQLQFCPHYNYNEAQSHHCFVLHAQQRNDYCAVATCQMILCYYRYYYTQDQIAPALGYGPGGCPSDQSPGYEQLSCNHLDATYDTTATFSEAITQINALHPFKSGISGHARACAGYSYNILFGTNRLYIYDPWPWNADYKLGGAVYWEDWDSINHTNYVFTKPTCP